MAEDHETTRGFRLAGLAVLLVCLGWWSAGVAGSAPDRYGTLDLKPCSFDAVPGEIACGYHRVHEDRAAGAGRTLDLYIRYAHARGGAANPEPIFVLAGGPGQSAVELMTRPTLQYLWAEHDAVFIDVRGTGRSNPLHCPYLGDPASLQTYADPPFVLERFTRCRDALSKKADLTQYTTDRIVDDMDEVRQALGAGRIQIFAGSYGTRPALHYVRKYGDHVRAAYIRGFSPPNAMAVARLAPDTDFFLDKLAADCAADAACSQAHPDFRANLDTVARAFATGQVTVSLPNPDKGGALEQVVLNDGGFRSHVRYSLYYATQRNLLPAAIQAAAGGDYGPIARAVIARGKISSRLVYSGAWASVKCAEELPYVDRRAALDAARGTFMGAMRVEQEFAICDIWPRGRVPDGFHAPVTADVQMLIVTGENDAASAPYLADFSARFLPNARFVLARTQGHALAADRPCVEQVAADFYRRGTAQGLDVSCLYRIAPPPFVQG